MAASRFECPRCQTVFVKDIGGDAAFVECPSCGALALPAGDATEGDLSRALSGPQAAPSFPGASFPGGPGARSDDGLASTEAEQPPTPSDPAAPAPGLFAGLLDSNAEQAPSSPAAPVSGSAKAPELDFDFGSDLGDLDFPAPPTTSPGMRNPMTSSRGPASELSSPFSAAPSTGAARAPVHALPPEALAALAQEAEAGPTNQQPTPFHTLSEEAFGDLEKAFDEMALKPAPAGPNGGLTADEERFLRGDEVSGSRPRPPPLRRDDERTGRSPVASAPDAPPLPTGRSKPPPRRVRRSTHFELSAEAKRLAFLPLVGPENSGSVARPRPASAPSSGAPRDEERVAPVTSSRPATPSQVAREDTDLVREKARARRPVPSAFQGLSALRVAAIVVVCGILGGVGGAFTAPPPKMASTPRARAELKFAEGNRYYDAGRFDDALGAFRATISIDSTFALPHRAKGAALAKLNRHDEAAQAYEEYLKLEPSAVDATDVKAALARRQGKSP